MKIKLFIKKTYSIESFEEKVNSFLLTHDIIDIKLSETFGGSSESFGSNSTLLVLYRN
ncbi:DUF2758 domain-containing protein [Streptococcus uberis]|uniref:DUF2758 domain-containing protein n=1 Tax=Streptococcus uberis TaxID=1349 RepID=UPI0021F125F0|nr:DUF2758 domain-containing protein [Streptococcus uberis]MCV6815752.1 DUF2758 domain-containing protein [Streptococcus uberis]MCZ8475766.1 DUF2758 domain-containing protein [Streptococcus uberis]